MDKLDFLRNRLDAMIVDGEKAKAKMLDNVEKMGVTYALQWGDSQMKAEQQSRAAQEATEMLDRALTDDPETAEEKVRSWAVERALTNCLYVVPDSSRAAEQVLLAQAYARIAEYVWK